MLFRLSRILFGSFFAIVILPILGQSAVIGNCSNCHTMHNSEEGSPVAFTRDDTGQQVFREQPFGYLLKTDCLGCHSHAGAETIITLGETNVPIIFNLTEPTYPPEGSNTSTLAGGNFYWLLTKGDAYGHNVYGIAAGDPRFPFTQAPGGTEHTGECTNCHGTLATAESGCKGCHVPQHHAGSADVVAGRDNGWYRFLGSVMQDADSIEPTPEGVTGIEAADWEQNPQSDQHNTYQGKPGPFVSYLETGSIDQKCAGCHGLFHDSTTENSVWIRHPVDAIIPDFGEFTEFSVYNPMVPVARQNVNAQDAGFSSINRGADLVSCISCHRAHGSPYPALLRWGYRDWPGEDSHTHQFEDNVCAVCHTSKN